MDPHVTNGDYFWIAEPYIQKWVLRQRLPVVQLQTRVLIEKRRVYRVYRPTRHNVCGGASTVLIQFLGALKVGPLTNWLVRPKAGATPTTDLSWE